MPGPVTIIRDRQLAIRRALDRRNLSLKILSDDSGLSYDTLKSYFPAWNPDKDPVPPVPAQIPGSAIFALCGHLPADLLSWLLPDGFLVVRAPEGIDHDAAAEAMEDYLQAKNRAHHPESEAGREIGPGEDGVLTAKLAVVRAA